MSRPEKGKRQCKRDTDSLFWVSVHFDSVHPLHDALCSENAQDHHVQVRKGVPLTPAASAPNHVRARTVARFEASLRPSERMEAEQ